MATILEPITRCEKCGGPVWDNRQNKKNPKGPDFKCKDTDCAEAFWLGEAKEGKAVPKTAPRPANLYTVGKLAEKMNEAYEALQVAGFGLDLITLDTCFKMAFTELKGRNPGD